MYRVFLFVFIILVCNSSPSQEPMEELMLMVRGIYLVIILDYFTYLL